MKIELLTIFPEMFESFLSASIIGRAREAGLLDIHATDIRPYSQNKHKNTDDYPFGGGAGMLMLAQPIADAMKAAAIELGVSLRWGAAWNVPDITKWEGTMADAMNHYIDERRKQGRRPFIDGPHFELV